MAFFMIKKEAFLKRERTRLHRGVQCVINLSFLALFCLSSPSPLFPPLFASDFIQNGPLSQLGQSDWLDQHYLTPSLDAWQEVVKLRSKIDYNQSAISKMVTSNAVAFDNKNFNDVETAFGGSSFFMKPNGAGMPYADNRLAKLIEGSTLHRKVVDATQYPWSAIGKINVIVSMSSNLNCTGALIGERIVLTAAHCVYIRQLKTISKPQLVNFVAGFQRDDFLVNSTAVQIITSPDYDGSKGTSMNNLANDWALLVLKEPIGRAVGYLGWRDIDQREVRDIVRQKLPLAIAGYPRDRKNVISLDDKCELAGYFNDNRLFGHRCKILNGDSGAPLGILDDKGNFTVVAVNSAAGKDNTGHGLNSAVPVHRFQEVLNRLLLETESSPATKLSNEGEKPEVSISGRKGRKPLSMDQVVDIASPTINIQ